MAQDQPGGGAERQADRHELALRVFGASGFERQADVPLLPLPYPHLGAGVAVGQDRLAEHGVLEQEVVGQRRADFHAAFDHPLSDRRDRGAALSAGFLGVLPPQAPQRLQRGFWRLLHDRLSDGRVPSQSSGRIFGSPTAERPSAQTVSAIHNRLYSCRWRSNWPMGGHLTERKKLYDFPFYPY